jgi:CelD/BcsL family acetyltransferase involved in cellulose biosynthesis
MQLHTLDPLGDPRWLALVDSHPSASVFHSRAWLESLRRAYGYEPVAFTTAAPGEPLSDAIVFCRIDSWLTGRRLVSLPFSDHSEPLVRDDDTLRAMLAALARICRRDGYRYLELRPVRAAVTGVEGFVDSGRFYLHRLDLGPSLEAIFGGLHKDCVRRKIRRAERDGVTCEEGRSPGLLEAFYGLFVSTCRVRRLPPQPLDWFRQLIECMGDALTLRIAFRDGQPIAGILTLRAGHTMTYKYGAADARFNNLGATPLLLWRAITEAKARGLRELDLGRSDDDNAGLLTFKDRWGTSRSVLRYARSPFAPAPGARARRLRVAKRCFATLPDPMLVLAGKLLHRHVA